MATKKTTTKKAPVKKKPVTKTTVSKRSSVAKSNSSRVLAIQPEQEDFMTFRVNRETVYWAVLGAVVILFAVWIMQLQADIQSLYDDIDANSAASDSIDLSTVKKS